MTKPPPDKFAASLAGVREKFPAMTYSRVAHTTIGPGCLTAVFGMGTGVTIQVSSPEKFVGDGKSSGTSAEKEQCGQALGC